MKRIIISLIVLLVTVSIRATETNDADAASIKSINDEQEGSDKYISNKNKQEVSQTVVPSTIDVVHQRM